jgi:ubiquinone biosynthesis protein
MMELCRVLAISKVFMCGAAEVGFRLALNLRRSHREAPARVIGEGLAKACVRLGPAFVKVGQILATRRDLLPDPMAAALSSLFDQLSCPVSTADLGASFRGDVGRDLPECFSEWKPRPVAVASVAAVYQARTPDGVGVAIKVLRPGVAELVELDLRLLRRATRVALLLMRSRLVALDDMVADIGESLVRQLDLVVEARTNEALTEAFADNPRLVLPKLIVPYCGRSVLTMTWIDGQSPRDVVGPCGDQVRTVLRALYQMIFVEGVIHCDLHPGNIRYLTDGRVALFDFGFMSTFREPDRLNFARFFYGLVRGDGRECARLAIETSSGRLRRFDPELFEQAMIDLVERTAGLTAQHFSVARFAAELFDIMRRHGLRGTTAFTMAIVSLAVVEGLVRDVESDIDFQAEARPFVLRALLQTSAR